MGFWISDYRIVIGERGTIVLYFTPKNGREEQEKNRKSREEQRKRKKG